MEIVSEPAIDSPEEAFAYLSSLKQILEYGEVSDADMEKGQLRCDCNVSVRPGGAGGARHEDRDQEYEHDLRRAARAGLRDRAPDRRAHRRAARCSRRRGAGTKPRARPSSCAPRSSAHDYRYFPDPDLMPVRTADFMDEVRSRVPELPAQKRERFERDYGVSALRCRSAGGRPAAGALFRGGGAGSEEAEDGGELGAERSAKRAEERRAVRCRSAPFRPGRCKGCWA